MAAKHEDHDYELREKLMRISSARLRIMMKGSKFRSTRMMAYGILKERLKKKWRLR